MVVLEGMPGAGKTTVAAALAARARRHGSVCLDRDRVTSIAYAASIAGLEPHLRGHCPEGQETHQEGRGVPAFPA